MSNRCLRVGDAVMIYIDDITQCNPNNARTAYGFIRFIGFIPYLESGKLTQSIGLELIEKIHDGHDGTVNNIQYLNAERGYGIIKPITNIIKKLSTTELMLELKRTIHILSEKNKYIQQLESITSQTTHQLLTKIDVNLPSDPQARSARNTFILAEPITPITPTTPNSTSSITSNIQSDTDQFADYYIHSAPFERNKSDNTATKTPTNVANYIDVNTPSLIPTAMPVSPELNEQSLPSRGTYKSRKSYKHRKSCKSRKSSKFSLDVFISNEEQKHSDPSPPIYCVSPLTPTSTHSPNIFHEDEYSMMSFAKRMELLRKKPVPEPRRNEKKQNKKSKKMKKKVQFQNSVHHYY